MRAWRCSWSPCRGLATMRVLSDGFTSHLCQEHWDEVRLDIGKGGVQAWQPLTETCHYGTNIEADTYCGAPATWRVKVEDGLWTRLCNDHAAEAGSDVTILERRRIPT